MTWLLGALCAHQWGVASHRIPPHTHVRWSSYNKSHTCCHTFQRQHCPVIRLTGRVEFHCHSTADAGGCLSRIHTRVTHVWHYLYVTWVQCYAVPLAELGQAGVDLCCIAYTHVRWRRHGSHITLPGVRSRARRCVWSTRVRRMYGDADGDHNMVCWEMIRQRWERWMGKYQ